MDQMHGSVEEQLDRLLRAYRAACPVPEPSVNFMPQLWQRIESRQISTFSFRRMANAFVTAAMAASLGLGLYMALPHGKPASPAAYASYVEVLADANAIEAPDIVAPVHVSLGDLQ